MIDILHRFLLQNRSISIPGLGTLHAERIPARRSPDGAYLIPPGYSFRFDKYFDAPDKAFFVYLSGRQGVPEYESMRLYNQFAQDFRSSIMLEEQADWPGVGYFRKNVSGEVEFVQTKTNETGYVPVKWKIVESVASKTAGPDEASLTVEPPTVEDVALTRAAVDNIPLIHADGSHAPKPTIENIPLVPADESQTLQTAIADIPLVSADKSQISKDHSDLGSVVNPEPELADSTANGDPEMEIPVMETLETEEGNKNISAVDYPLTLEEESIEPVRTRKIIMRIGWGIAAAASLLTILHFSQHGFNLKAAANNQMIHPARP